MFDFFFLSEGSVALGRIILYLRRGCNFYFFTNHFLVLGSKSAHVHIFPETLKYVQYMYQNIKR